MTRAEQLKIEIARKRAEIANNDKAIEDREYRVSLCRQHGDRLYNRLILLEAQLEREEALLIKPEGPCAVVDNWKV